ncbi:MAG: 5'-methylthioadenosine/adenosylhomocysteine nucleosidase, partial [Clostridia bacterium]|nr:5'-methylthioadenosine/adenosylhomocysteine nucleosidase [Clostridia bacterium]
MKIGVIAALSAEAENIISVMEDVRVETVPSLTFTSGRIGKTDVVCTVCGVGKVYAAAAAEAMILKYAPDLVV